MRSSESPTRGARQALEALAGHDPALPLGLLLDDAALGRWLSERCGTSLRVSRRYLRYKPGTSLLLRLDVAGPDSTEDTWVLTAFGAGSRAKLAKALATTPRRYVVHADASAGILVGTPAGDRDLPGLRRLADDPAGCLDRALRRTGAGPVAAAGPWQLTSLAYKPHRRWVGRADAPGADPLLLRLYRPHDLAGAALALRRLQGSGAPVQRLRGLSRRRGLTVLDWVAGEPASAESDPGDLHAVGAALARLHDQPCRLPDHALAAPPPLGRAARALGAVLPVEGARARTLARLLGARVGLRHSPAAATATLHGDFSLDQVVIGPSGRATLLDLDRAGRGDREVDLGSLVGSVLTEHPDPGTATRVLDDVLGGYRATRGGLPLDGPGLADQAAAALLLRATEPFRHGHPDWPTEAVRMLDLAEDLAQHGLAVLSSTTDSAATRRTG